MEKRLLDAAMEGDIKSLHGLLQEDRLILHRSIVSCVSETPLHVSSILGHANFVQELLSLNPELASELDSHGCSALHLAAAKGHVEIVKELVKVDPGTCTVRNEDGKTPLHVAAIKGKVEVARVLMIKVLLTSPGLEINAINKNGLTALDTFRQSPRDLRDMQIECILRDAGVLSAKNLRIIATDWHPSPTKLPQITKSMVSNVSTVTNNSRKPLAAHKHKHTDWLGRKRSALVVVASLLATVAFQAAITPPGGVWQADETVDERGNPLKQPHIAGTAVMAYSLEFEYGKIPNPGLKVCTRRKLEVSPRIIKFLLTSHGLDINATNKNGFTALDTLRQSPRDLRDMEIECILKDAGVLSAKDLHTITPDWLPCPTKVPRITKSMISNVSTERSISGKPLMAHKHTDWLGRKRSALMVVASLIATVAFQSAITPPGGVWQADEHLDEAGNPLKYPRKAGTAVMAYSQKTEKYGYIKEKEQEQEPPPAEVNNDDEDI
ncbi:hypothetical protein COLO4_18143 [Corchorus olitorius]|uniref:PGG domain-containing protein n=1 Tax=Corchorus olitorius TaxID=93759 RepID=A0A1R3JA66_9ROSI|nr:hypothetical protein COLO4_18143 [Corchorus olitorius]